MGFDVYGPTRHVCASNVDDGVEPRYDLLALPRAFGLDCPQLASLSRRFYDSTTLRVADGHVQALRDELICLRDAYRASRESGLITERHIHTGDPELRRSIVDRLLLDDPVCRALDAFRLVCDEAIETNSEVRCLGD